MALAFLPPKRGPDGGGVGRALLGPHTQGSCLILCHLPSTTPCCSSALSSGVSPDLMPAAPQPAQQQRGPGAPGCGLLIVIRVRPSQEAELSGKEGRGWGAWEVSLRSTLEPGTVQPHLGEQWAVATLPLPSHRYFLKESPMCCLICCRPW